MISQRLLETLRFFRRNLPALLLVTAPFALLAQGVQWWQGDLVVPGDQGDTGRINAVTLLLVMLVRPFADAALATQLGGIQNGQPRPLSDCLLMAASNGPWVLAAYLIIGLALITPLLLLAPIMTALSPQLGSVIFLILALWITARLSLTPFLVVLEGGDPLMAVKTSFSRTATQQWPLLGAMVLVGLLAAVLLEMLGQSLFSMAGKNYLSEGVLALLGGLGSALVMIVIFRFYVLTAETPTPPTGPTEP